MNLTSTGYVRRDVRVLIDTWWNVNPIEVGVLKEVRIVLIDTWWNVNDYACLFLPNAVHVLIDTWWNVNSVQQLCYFPVSSFNRYMVECESIMILTFVESTHGFNRYMVECEYTSM